MDASSAERLILVLEDNPDHVSQIQHAFEKSTIHHRLVAIASGVDAMDCLHGQGSYGNIGRPDLILLNLNLPDKGGLEVLADLKADPRLRRIPIIVLASSDREEDVLNSYALQGNCYVIKSTDLEQLFHIVRRIEEFWLGIVTLPVE